LVLPLKSEVRSWTGTVGLLYRPWYGTRSFKPFLTAGVGLTQERYSWQKQENEALPGKDRSISSGAVIVGVGFDLRAGPLPFRLEVADMWTPKGERMKGSAGPSFSSAWPPRRHSRHNLNFSVGVVLGLH